VALIEEFGRFLENPAASTILQTATHRDCAMKSITMPSVSGHNGDSQSFSEQCPTISACRMEN
jgi:hypothetical protein